ncbi:hypothetical protein ASZ78_014792 [Callipepla squamata]|uniref:Uncharacterized protein n=1 Tax=Callipepla squamata TaxID=9009 RepID=A0A226M8B8_CALSU|nr:hypothetical protein ASZ78_014792 [Callipepla squamata]
MEEARLEDEKLVVGCANIILPRHTLQVFLLSFLAEADVSGLPLKRSFAERQGRTMECVTAPKRGTDTQQASGAGLSFNLVAFLFFMMTGRVSERNGKCRANEVCSQKAHRRTEFRAHDQSRGLPCRAGPSPVGRPSPAVNPHSLSMTLAGRKRKGLEEEKQMSERLPAHKRVRGEHNGEMCQRRGSVSVPAAHPGPAPEWISKKRGEKVLRNLFCLAAALGVHTEIA